MQINYLKDQSVRELFNPFSTIAVWAAVRFVINKSTTKESKIPNDNHNHDNTNPDGYSCAFLPLISDPGEDERKRLFQPMSEDLKDVLMRRTRRHKVKYNILRQRIKNGETNP